MRVVVRRKVIVVPFIRTPGDNLRFLVVKDRKSKEWTFITGGCKARESDDAAALRELTEETRNVVDFTPSFRAAHVNAFHFRTTYRERKELIEDRARNERVVTDYAVYAIDVTNTIEVDALKRAFRNAKHMRGAFNENTDLNFETLESFSNKTHVWNFIRDHVLVNRQFLTHIHGLKGGSPIAV